MNPEKRDADVPLCIDCDGTLIRTDLLFEGLLLLIKQSPLSLLLLPVWLLRGKAFFKQRIAERVQFDWGSLPYSEPVLRLIDAARATKRKVILATASPRTWADAVARHLAVFDGVVATEGFVNLGGRYKADRLVELYGQRGFDYVGNGRSDVPVWSMSRRGVVVSGSRPLLASARQATTVQEVIASPSAGILAYLRMIRVHQWMKNLLVAVPILAAHRVGSFDSFVPVVIAFVSFSFCASAVYLINDLLDIEADRAHVRKRKRSLAAGAIPVQHALVLAPILLGVSVALALRLPISFVIVLATYFVVTLAYSLRLKRQVVVDVILLAALYTMRVIGGAMAISVQPSFWLLAFSTFLFLSLAIVKRYSEMQVVLAEQKHAAAGRGYLVSDLPVLLSLGISAGMAAVLVLSLYINDVGTGALYPQTFWIWFAPPLILYWISRVWMKAHRGEVEDDPVLFAIRDWQSLLTVLLVGMCFFLGTLQ